MRPATDGFVDVPGGYLYYQQHDERRLAGIARVTTGDHRNTGLSAPGLFEPYVREALDAS